MSQPPVSIRHEGAVTVVTLDDGRANALGTPMLQALVEAAEAVEGASAVLLCGRAKVFCGGLDLEHVLAMDQPGLLKFLDLFHRAMMAWLALPSPVVSAVSGSAVAGGAILMMSGDIRVGADDSGLVGVNESRLGLPFPSSALELFRCGLDPMNAQRALLLGEILPKRGALARGFFHELAGAEQLNARAMELAADIASLPVQATVHTKAALRREFIDRARANEASTREAFMRAWFAPAAQERLRAVLARIKK